MLAIRRASDSMRASLGGEACFEAMGGDVAGVDVFPSVLPVVGCRWDEGTRERCGAVVVGCVVGIRGGMRGTAESVYHYAVYIARAVCSGEERD